MPGRVRPGLPATGTRPHPCRLARFGGWPLVFLWEAQKAGQVQLMVNKLGNEPGQVCHRQPLIQGRREEHYRVRLEGLDPFVHTILGIHHIINAHPNTIDKGLVKQPILRH